MTRENQKQEKNDSPQVTLLMYQTELFPLMPKDDDDDDDYVNADFLDFPHVTANEDYFSDFHTKRKNATKICQNLSVTRRIQPQV